MLPICLAEIERTRPYFIGLLGQRYGWVPDEIPAALATELGWLSDDAGRSVTELEILHGVLNDPDAAGHAFFYLRDPPGSTRVPDDERSTFVEEADGRHATARRTPRAHPAERVPVADYADPIALGDQVLADLTALVESLYPDPTPPDPLTRAASIQRVVRREPVHRVRRAPRSRPARRVGGRRRRPRCWSPARPASGRRRWSPTGPTPGARPIPTTAMVVHHVEADSDAADHRSMVRRIVAELGVVGRLGRRGPDAERSRADTTDDPAALRSMLRQAFSARRDPTIVVLDGVDRLDDVDGAPDLRWLPAEMPAERADRR